MLEELDQPPWQTFALRRTTNSRKKAKREKDIVFGKKIGKYLRPSKPNKLLFLLGQIRTNKKIIKKIKKIKTAKGIIIAIGQYKYKFDRRRFSVPKLLNIFFSTKYFFVSAFSLYYKYLVFKLWSPPAKWCLLQNPNYNVTSWTSTKFQTVAKQRKINFETSNQFKRFPLSFETIAVAKFEPKCFIIISSWSLISSSCHKCFISATILWLIQSCWFRRLTEPNLKRAKQKSNLNTISTSLHNTIRNILKILTLADDCPV